MLVTSRRRLTALEDATVISLDTLSASEAAELLARLADRAELASGAGPAGELIRLCGYLPLAIGMLASQLRHHPAWTAAGMAAGLAAARDRLAMMYAENLSVAAAFDLSYRDLTAAQQRLFRRVGLVPGPGFDAYAAAALDGTSLATARRGLADLYDQHLLTEPAPGRYQLHDLLREHARTLAAADSPAESDAAAGRLLDYYLHAALAAGRHFGPQRLPPPPGRPAAGRGPGPVHSQAEALNRLGELSLRTSATGQAHDQHTRALAIARAISAPPEQARAPEGIGRSHLQDGNPGQAAAHLQQALTIYQRIGAPAARRVRQTLQDHQLKFTSPEPRLAAPASEGASPHTP